MSGGDGTPPGKPPKQLSSRLMTMKFMQRAAATPTGAAAASASSGASGPSAKRLKNNSSQPSTPPNGPSTGTRTPAYPAAASEPASSPRKSGKGAEIDWQRAAREAARAEEDRRQAALDRTGTHGEETRWVLRTEDQNGSAKPRQRTGLRILRYGEVDVGEDQEAEGDDEDQPWRADGVATGRMRFGGFKRKGETKLPAKDTSDDDGSGADSDGAASRSSKSSSKQSPAQNSTPRSGVHTPTRGRGGGISSGGGGGSSGRPSDGSAKCFRCGQPGHIKSNCPMNQGTRMSGTKRARS